MPDHIKVCVRFRPPLPEEKNVITKWRLSPENENCIVPTENKDKKFSFTYDKVYWCEPSTDDSFGDSGVLNAFNGTLFA